MTESTGRKLGGFLLTQLLGQGAMGAVYKGKQLSLDRDVAVKVILPTYADNPDYIRRFEREAKLIAQLTHQNITQIYEFGRFDGFYLIVMEYIEGTSLKSLLSELKRLESYTVCEMLFQVASGISMGASKNIVHRDIKPENIQISKKGVCKILDFGLAKDESGTSQMTMAGGILGTPSFMSPEQCQGKSVDYRADIYALGTSAYYLLTGEVPYKADSQLAVLNMHCNAPIPDPRLKNPNCDDGLAEIVMKLMSKKPEDRCSSADEIVSQLQEVLFKIPNRKPLASLANEWDWDKMIEKPSISGTSLLNQYQGKDSNTTDRTIVTGSSTGAATAQMSSFNEETLVSNSNTAAYRTAGQTTPNTIGATQNFEGTLQPGHSVTNQTRLDSTLQPTVGATQMGSGQTMMEQQKSSKAMPIALVLVALVAVFGFFLFKGGEDWTDVRQRIVTIRNEVQQENRFDGIDRAKAILSQYPNYPEKASLEKEIENWVGIKTAYDDYNKIVSTALEGKYQDALAQTTEFKNKFGPSNKYWGKLVVDIKNWKEFEKAEQSKSEAISLAEKYKYNDAINKLNEVKARYPTFETDNILKLLTEYEIALGNQKRGTLGEDIKRAEGMVKDTQYLQAARVLKVIKAKGNESEKKSIESICKEVSAKLQDEVDEFLKTEKLRNFDEDIDLIKSLAGENNKWLETFKNKYKNLKDKYDTLFNGANVALQKGDLVEASKKMTEARNIAKLAEDEKQFLVFTTSFHLKSAEAFIAKKSYDLAFQELKSANKLAPDDKVVLEKMSEVEKLLIQNKKSDEELKEFNRLVEKGDKLFSEKKYSEALIVYKSAESIHSQDKTLDTKIHNAEFQIEVAEVDKLMNEDSDNTNLLNSKVDGLKKIALSENEKKQITKIISDIENKKSSYLIKQIESSLEASSFQEAETYLTELSKLNAQSEKHQELSKKLVNSYMKSADELISKSLYTRAYSLLEAANRVQPSKAVQDKMKDIQKAKEEEKSKLEKIEKIQQLVKDARILYESKDYKKALEKIEEAYSFDSKNIDVVSIRAKAGYEYYAAIGFEANEATDFAKAIENLRKALEYDPARPNAKTLLEKLERPKAEIILIDTAAKAVLQQKAWASFLGLPIEKTYKIGKVNFDFILVPAGKFKMGSEEGGDSDEKPARIVTISKPYYLLKHEVTNAQYAAFNPNEKSFSSKPDEPVLGIVYSKLLQFTKFLDAEFKSDVRAPTEAEWEFACRAGNTGDYCFGNKLPDLNSYGFFADNSKKINSVMKLKPNAYGLYDMHGNAFEWCRDFYDKKAYKELPDVDPYNSDSNKTKVIRGGSYDSTPANLRNSNRNSMPYAQRELLSSVGFRILLEIKQ